MITILKKSIQVPFLSGFFISVLIHTVVAGVLYYGIVFNKKTPVFIEVDLSLGPTLYRSPKLGSKGTSSREEWSLPQKERDIRPMETKIETDPEGEKVLASAHDPHPGTETGEGGIGEGEGEYISASKTYRKPHWIANFILPQDYPALLKEQGKNGRVVLSLLIDEKGRVLDVKIVEGSHNELNEVVLRKIKQAIFTPAFNKDNIPVPCKVMLPIRFELK